MDAKKLVGIEIAKKVKSNQTIAVGSGTTVMAAVAAIAERAQREKFSVRFVPTSYQTAWALSSQGLTVISPMADADIDWGFDGADKVDSELRAVKGLGAHAMLKEKILAARCPEYYYIVDSSKLSDNILEIPIPVEVIPDARSHVFKALAKIGATNLEVKTATNIPVLTECGNLVVNATFKNLSPDLEQRIRSIVGVVESGLFYNYADGALIADGAGVRTINKKRE